MPLSFMCPCCAWGGDIVLTPSIDYKKTSVSAASCAFERIHFCPKCSVGMAFPQLTDEAINGLYSGGDYWQKYKVELLLPRKNPGHYAMAQSRWQFLEQCIQSRPDYKKGIAILDVGAGYGFFGFAAQQSQDSPLLKYCTTEKDKFFREALDLTWKNMFPNVAFSSCDQMSEVEGKYDVVVLSHIIEHINDPKALIAFATTKLNKGGMVFIDVPHEDFLFKADVFPHVLFYNAKSLKALMSAAGLETVAIDTFGRSREVLKNSNSISGRLSVLLENIAFKARHILPTGWMIKFFDWYLKPGKRNSDGVWLRAVAIKS